MSEASDWIREQLRPLMVQGEEILQFGYLVGTGTRSFLGSFGAKAYWAALTPGRLYLINTRVGAFKPLRENKGVDTYERPDIIGVVRRGATLAVELIGGRRLEYLANAKVKQLPEQTAFLETLAGQHPAPPEMQAAVGKRMRTNLILGIVIAVVGGGLAIYKYAYGDRVEARVECRGQNSAIVCEVTRTGGAADAKVCWDTVIHCANGARVPASSCSPVPDKGGKEQVTLPETSFSNVAACDKAQRIEVTNMKLSEP